MQRCSVKWRGSCSSPWSRLPQLFAVTLFTRSGDPVFLCTELCTATERRPLPAGVPHWKEGRWVGAEQTGGHEKEQQCLQLLLVATIRKTIYLKSEVQFFCSDPGIYSRNNMSIIWLDNKKNHRLQSALSESKQVEQHEKRSLCTESNRKRTLPTAESTFCLI